MKHIECNLCGSQFYDIIYKQPKVLPSHQGAYLISENELLKPERICKCLTCGLIFAEKDEHFDYIKQYEEMVDQEYLNEEHGRRLASIKILDRISQYKKEGALLDIGCANGFLLDEARKKNFKVSGVEISRWAANFAREQYNLNITQGTLFSAGFPDQSFDVVVMLDVIEHLYDPKSVLLEIRRILKNDGLCYISTPNIKSFMSRILRAKWWGINKFHLYYFTKRTLERMINACGFQVVKYMPHVRIFSIKYGQNE